MAQEVMSVLPLEPTQLNFVEKSNFDSLKTMASTEAIKIVSTILPESANNDGIVQVTIPETNLHFKFKCTYSEYTDSDNFVWYGELQRPDNVKTFDRVILVKKDGMLLGDIQVDYFIYKIFPIAVGKQIFFKWPNQTGNLSNKPNTEKSEVADCVFDYSLHCTIRVLVAYTPELLNSSLNSILVLSAILFVVENNMVFLNSQIKHKLVLTDVYRIPGTTFEMGNVSSTRDKLSTDLSTSTSNLRIKQLQTQSDIVMVMCKGDWVGSSTNDAQFGQSTFTGPHCPFNENLGSVIKFSECQGGKRTFNHEMGHLFSALHEPYSFSNPGGACTSPRCAYKWTSNGVDYFTMMHAVNNCVARTLSYSNSYITVNGVLPGNSNQCNAKGIQECGCDVSLIQPNPVCTPTLSVTFNKTCNPTKATFKVTDAISCGSNLKYEFSHSINGVTYTISCPNSTTSSCNITFSTPPLSGDFLFVRVKIYKVVNGQNQILSTLFGSYKTCTTPLQTTDDRYTDDEMELSNASKFTLFPEPF
jgi:hypothetical protein